MTILGAIAVGIGLVELSGGDCRTRDPATCGRTCGAAPTEASIVAPILPRHLFGERRTEPALDLQPGLVETTAPRSVRSGHGPPP